MLNSGLPPAKNVNFQEAREYIDVIALVVDTEEDAEESGQKR